MDMLDFRNDLLNDRFFVQFFLKGTHSLDKAHEFKDHDVAKGIKEERKYHKTKRTNLLRD
jgi:hypothetical protein